MSYLNPTYIKPGQEDLGEEFEALLKRWVPYNEEAFGGDYCWNAPIPPQETWGDEITALVDHLEEQWGGNYPRGDK